MNNSHLEKPNLKRFVDAQEHSYATALAEIRAGRKLSHWIWYIFPQLRGLGHSPNSEYYGIESFEEAKAYLEHDVLGVRLREITNALLQHRGKDARDIFGTIDAKKVCSSMTLFDVVSPNDIFAEVLEVFYNGRRCRRSQHHTQNSPKMGDIDKALSYIGVNPADFALENIMFARPSHEAIHGIGHIYRTMVGCAYLGLLLERPRDGFLAFCGAYIHDLARLTDFIEPEHGANAAKHYFDKFNALWNKYNITEEEREFIRDAVTQHSGHRWMKRSDKGYDVMAILKDADALDRCRLGDLNVEWLRYAESRSLVELIAKIYSRSWMVNDDIPFAEFIEKFCSNACDNQH
ncbi:MAG: DUF1810 family protein [Alistipes sp.]|nr:DUF1810 family protein [Alistipes sp.]